MSTRTARGAALWIALLLVAAAAPAGAVAAPATAVSVPGEEDLHWPGHASHFAFVDTKVTARVAPGFDRAHVARIGTRTQDRTSQVLLILARVTAADGTQWLKVRLPVRPNGTVGWIPRSAVGEIRRNESWLRINTRTRTLKLIRKGKVILRARIGVGQPQWPTPRGEFFVRSRLSGRSLGAIYGPLAFGTSATSDVLTDWPGGGFIGIHGTNQPWLIGGRVSHGCIRLRNADIVRLGRRLQIGTPITIT
jgi:lipoprotein-anchoring transpeptidase ErfK/SrfK